MEVLWLKFLILHQMYILAPCVIRCKQSFLVLFASLFFIISQKNTDIIQKKQSICMQAVHGSDLQTVAYGLGAK